MKRLRMWFLEWLDIDNARFSALNDRLNMQAETINGLIREVGELKSMRAKRDLHSAPLPVTDWETVQAMWAANPENYKENA